MSKSVRIQLSSLQQNFDMVSLGLPSEQQLDEFEETKLRKWIVNINRELKMTVNFPFNNYTKLYDQLVKSEEGTNEEDYQKYVSLARQCDKWRTEIQTTVYGIQFRLEEKDRTEKRRIEDEERTEKKKREEEERAEKRRIDDEERAERKRRETEEERRDVDEYKEKQRRFRE